MRVHAPAASQFPQADPLRRPLTPDIGPRMLRESFLRLVSQRVYPALRSAGFKGSGATLRRVNGPVLHVFNVQGGSAGQEFFINLGATLTNLEMHGVTPDSTATAKEQSCAFRERIDPPGRPRMAWQYPMNDAAAERTLDAIAQQYANVGEPWFTQHGTWPESFIVLTTSEDILSIHPAHMRVLARIAMLLATRERADSLARAALERCPASASGLRHDLQQLLSATGAA